MKACKYFCIGATLALLGAFVQVGAQETFFFSGVKVRGGVQLASREDNLSSVFMGFGLEAGCAFRFGRLSGEAGFSYKPGNQYLRDLSLMPNPDDWIIIYPGYWPDRVPNEVIDIINSSYWPKEKKTDLSSVDSRKNQLDGLYFRAAYEKPFQHIGLRVGVQVGGSDFRQEYIADISGWRKLGNDNQIFNDTYNGIHNKNQLSISPFGGISISSENYFLEIQLIGVSYTMVDYIHVPGTEPGKHGGGHTLFDPPPNKYKRFVPHIEFTLGFRL
ncbi:MAG: hypothetical protein LBB40_05925 [Holophagales bacterium]|jgi:hypothetical protein|nr:hypothetical protein [Holophagales bacterium]